MLFMIPPLAQLLSSLYYLVRGHLFAAIMVVSIMRDSDSLTVSVYFHYACFPQRLLSILLPSVLKLILKITEAPDSVKLTYLGFLRATLRSTVGRNYQSLLRKAIESPSAVSAIEV